MIIYTSIKKDSSTVEIYDKNENKLFSYIAEEYMDDRVRQPKNGLINGKELDSIDINDIYRIDEITQELIIYIKDSGIGMPESTINKLFKIDEKISRPGTEGESSTGLGLLLCKEYIDKHNGKIWAESEINKGSTFFVSLPKV